MVAAYKDGLLGLRIRIINPINAFLGVSNPKP